MTTNQDISNKLILCDSCGVSYSLDSVHICNRAATGSQYRVTYCSLCGLPCNTSYIHYCPGSSYNQQPLTMQYPSTTSPVLSSKQDTLERIAIALEKLMQQFEKENEK